MQTCTATLTCTLDQTALQSKWEEELPTPPYPPVNFKVSGKTVTATVAGQKPIAEFCKSLRMVIHKFPGCDVTDCTCYDR